MSAATLLSTLLAVPALVPAAYLGALGVLGGELPPTPPGPGRRRFVVVVPAHDEERGIAATVASLRAMDWPAEQVRIVVVADNCADATAARAAAAGAEVLVRVDASRRGKGHALAFAFERVLSDAWADAVVVVDADTSVSRELLRAFDARFEAGTEALQAEYGVRNPGASWRTRLLVVALATFHGARSNARERLGLSVGLRGNGMAFARSVLERVPYTAYSLVEDVEYGLRLGEAGIRVGHVPEARVLGDMAASSSAAETQRDRWERGRRALARGEARRLLRLALARRDPMLADLAADLLVPPLASLVATLGAGLGASAVWGLARGAGLRAPAPWALGLAMLVPYVARGVQLSGAGPRVLVDLAWAPVYMAWKLRVRRRAPVGGGGPWTRTARAEGAS